MLVIRCREGESISIGSDIQINVLSIDAGRVKLGFVAPTNVPVARRCVELTQELNKDAVRGIDREALTNLTPYLPLRPGEPSNCVVAVYPRRPRERKTLDREIPADK